MVWRTRTAGLLTGVVLAPVLAGLAGTLAQSQGGWAPLWAWPGLVRSLSLSLMTGLASTVMALGLTLLILATLPGTQGFGLVRRMISPLMALPHAAAALGLAFLISPSGWVVRALSPWATGWKTPPDLLILNDPFGISLTLGLAAKETPFLLLLALAAWPQTDASRRLALAASLGYGRISGFVFAVLPALMRQLRLPVHAVLAYAVTSVDMGLVLGPNLPAPLAVQVLHWAQAPDLTGQALAAAGAITLLVAVALAILACEGLARLAQRGLRALAALGPRVTWTDVPARGLAWLVAYGMTLGLLAGLASLGLWSLAGLWPFPNVLPQTLTLTTWGQDAVGLWTATLASLTLGLASDVMALGLALALLSRPSLALNAAIYLPLLIPQIVLVPGLAKVALALGGGFGWISVVLAHLIFVLPYVLLSLSGPWFAWDSRQQHLAASLGASPARIYLAVRLPMLLPAILTALAVGFAVSIGQYLPTLLMSGGRIPTLTTEALALASGGNRRLVGALAVLQMALPAAGFLLAMALPRLVFARRRAMITP